MNEANGEGQGYIPDKAAVDAGHAFYTRRSLAVYDPMILGFFSRVAWRCPAPRLLRHYNTHISANHLDVGVGTGWFVDHATFPSPAPRLALMDLNHDCLDAASRRTARYSPEVYVANVLEPINVDTRPFESIALNYLLHCLPGTMHTKAVAFDHLLEHAEPGAKIFGATLLHDGVKRNFVARRVMDRNNAHGIFSNAHDDLDTLRDELEQRLHDPSIEIEGCVALFAGTSPG